jgi:hypothetical protein
MIVMRLYRCYKYIKYFNFGGGWGGERRVGIALSSYFRLSADIAMVLTAKFTNDWLLATGYQRLPATSHTKTKTGIDRGASFKSLCSWHQAKSCSRGISMALEKLQ